MFGVQSPAAPWLSILVAALCATAAAAGARTPGPEDPEQAPHLGTEPLWPVEASTDDRPYWSRNLFVRVAQDQKYLITDGWRSQFRDYRFSVPFAIALAGASGDSGPVGFDGSLQPRVSLTGKPGEPVAEALTSLGDAKTAAVAIGATYLVSRWTGNERGRRVSSLSAEALINSAIYVGLLKRVTRRVRPEGGQGDFFVDTPAAGQELTSFPSGHAAGAFAVAAVLAAEYRGRRWIVWTAYGTAGLIALSRVSLDRHFPSDVIVGGLLGGSLGRTVTRRAGLGPDASPLGPAGGRWFPVAGPSGGVGIGWAHTW